MNGGGYIPIAHKSAISIGLLYISVSLYMTTKDTSISFNQLCKDSKEWIRYKKYCPSCDKEISNDDTSWATNTKKGNMWPLRRMSWKKSKPRRLSPSMCKTSQQCQRQVWEKPMNCSGVLCFPKRKLLWQKQWLTPMKTLSLYFITEAYKYSLTISPCQRAYIHPYRQRS